MMQAHTQRHAWTHTPFAIIHNISAFTMGDILTETWSVPYAAKYTVNQFNLAAIKFSVLKVLNIRH